MNSHAVLFGIKRVPFTLILAIILTIGTGIFYIVLAILSEHRSYSKPSLDYMILTSTIIKDLPFELPVDAHYTYSAADGPKPAINTVEYFISSDRDHSAALIGNFLLQQGLTEQSPGVFAGDGQEVLVRWLSQESSNPRIRIEVLDYISTY
jgi:hypothetical protein